MQAKVADAKLFSRFIQDVTDKLEILYKDQVNQKEILLQKEKILHESQKDYKRYSFKTKEYDFYQSLKLNNAVILAFKTYYDDFPEFEKRFQKVDKSLPQFIQSYQEN